MPREPYPGYYREKRRFFARATALMIVTLLFLFLFFATGCAHIPPETYCGRPGGGPLFWIDCPPTKGIT